MTGVPMTADISDFRRREFRFNGVTKTVLVTGDSGPAVIILHEIMGFTPSLARFCRWLRDAGFRVYAPILAGRPDATNSEKPGLLTTVGVCISREFTVFASDRSSPIVDWLRPLARTAHGECGGAGVGVVGMCLTGGFALSMAVEGSVLVPVMSQPSLPVRDKAALDISPADLARVKARVAKEGLIVHGFRFAGDTLSQQPRFDTLARELGAGFVGTVIPDACGNPAGMRARGKPPHSVFTGDLIDAVGEPTRAAVDTVIAVLRDRLMPPATSGSVGRVERGPERRKAAPRRRTK